jgi:hypothetical protein
MKVGYLLQFYTLINNFNIVYVFFFIVFFFLKKHISLYFNKCKILYKG